MAGITHAKVSPKSDGSDATQIRPSDWNAEHVGGVEKSLYDAHSILMATDDNTPIALTVAAQTLIGRITGGTIASLTVGQIKTLLGVAAASGIASLNANSKVVEQPASISDFLDNTAGGTDAEVTKAPTSNVVYDHGVAVTGIHGVADYAQLASILFTSNVANFTLANTANAQSPFEAARDVLTVAGNTTYIMRGLYQITAMGGTTRTTALEFDGGNCTFTSISYYALIQTGAAQTLGTAISIKHSIAATAQILNATVTTAACTIWFEGLVRINGAGTFIPQIKWSADPTGTPVCNKDSFIMLIPVGIKTVGSIGNWG